MIVIFDLDYTLLDTEKLRKDLAKILGMSYRNFSLSYDKYFKNEEKNYDFNTHLKLLKKEKFFSPKKNFSAEIKKLLKNTNSYLYDGAEDVVKKFKKRGDYLILATFGNERWQAKKINNLKIKKYFNRIILMEKNKHLRLKFLNKYKKKILIINDNARESLKIKKELKQAKICLVNGRYAKNIRHNLKINKLKDCLKMYE